jgi:hypothetical protein
VLSSSARAKPRANAAPSSLNRRLPPENQAEAEVVAFVGLLQDKGRFVDFLMDDVALYNDAQVGAAARVFTTDVRTS